MRTPFLKRKLNQTFFQKKENTERFNIHLLQDFGSGAFVILPYIISHLRLLNFFKMVCFNRFTLVGGLGAKATMDKLMG